jgi:porin
MKILKQIFAVSLLLVPVLLFLSGTAHAQEKLLPPVSDVTTNKSSVAEAGETNSAADLISGSSGDVSQVPANLHPFQLTLPRTHLLGDWFGLRTNLEDRGITPTLTFVTDLAGNPVGGKSQGFTEADNLGLDLLFDLNKLLGLEGGSFLVSMSQRSGSSLSAERVGNLFTIQQVYGGQTFHLINVDYKQQFLDGRAETSIGRIGAGDDFLVSAYNYLFMQNGFCGNPVGIFFNSPGMSAYPNATWGARLKVKPTERTYVMGGVYNGDPSIRDIDHNGADMSMNGPVFVIGEVGYKRNGLAGDSRYLGNYKVGFWYDNSAYTDYNSVGYAQPAGTKRGNWGLYTLFDQVLFPFGEPGSNRGFGVFGSFLVSPDESVSQLPYFFTAGVASRGIFESRPIDVAGFGVVYGSFSSDLSNAQEREQLLAPVTGVQNYETVFEWTYRFNLRKGAVFIQPDIQYVINPGGAGQINDALVLGCQLGFNF